MKVTYYDMRIFMEVEIGFSIRIQYWYQPMDTCTKLYKFGIHVCICWCYYCVCVCVYIYNGFGGLGVACWPLVPKFVGSNPAEAVGFLGRKKSSARLPSEGK